MSSFGSSLINKSGKKIAPKLGVRRRPPKNLKSTPISISSESDETARDASKPPAPSGASNTETEQQAQRTTEPTSMDLPSASSSILDFHITPLITPPGTSVSAQEQSVSDEVNDLSERDPKRPRVERENGREKENASFVDEQRRPEAHGIDSTPPGSIRPELRISSRTKDPVGRESDQPSTKPPAPTTVESQPLLSSIIAQNPPREPGQSASTQSSVPQLVQYETPSSAVSTNEEPVEVQDEDMASSNWVVTTPAQISKAGKQRASARTTEKGKNKALAAGNGVRNGTSIAESCATANKSARLANRDRRKRRKQQVARAIGQAAPANAERGIPASPDVASAHESTNELDTQDEHDTGDETRPSSRKKRQRAPTPEESETVTIVPSMVTMFELAARDRRTGQKSEREKRMRQINWTEVKRRRHEENIRLAKAGRRRQKATEQPENEQEDEEASQSVPRVRVRIVNGEHIFENLRVDRHALANEDLDTLEEVEAHNETDHFNSHTYVRLKRREVAERMPTYDKWSSEDTEKFYDFLSRFGTDFMVITHMFPSRTRRQVKAKYTREERLNPDRIKTTLENYDPERLGWDLEVFRESSGWEGFKDPRQVEEELKALREVEEKNIEEKRKEVEEIRRQRRLAGDISDDEEAMEAGASGISKNSTRQTITIGGDELEIVVED